MAASFADIHAEDTNESRLIRYMPSLFKGMAMSDGSWVTIRQANLMSSARDEAMYATDFVITVNGKTVGYLDPEKKLGWEVGTRPDWPYLNIPVHPMGDWVMDNFGARTTNKLQSFSQHPDGSFFVAARRDWDCLLVVPFRTVLTHGIRRDQLTRYSSTPLPVLSIPMQLVTHIQAEQDDALSRFIVNHLEEHAHAAH